MKMFSQMSNKKMQFNVINIPTAIKTGIQARRGWIKSKNALKNKVQNILQDLQIRVYLDKCDRYQIY